MANKQRGRTSSNRSNATAYCIWGKSPAEEPLRLLNQSFVKLSEANALAAKYKRKGFLEVVLQTAVSPRTKAPEHGLIRSDFCLYLFDALTGSPIS